MALWRLCLLTLCVAEQLPDDECTTGTCSLELHQLRAQKEEAKLEVAKANVTSGSCSADDEAVMMKLGGGNADGTFPKIVANCGHSAYSFWSGFNQGKMSSCIAKETGMSSSCVTCFGGSGKYGYDHCKLQCLFGSWCSNLCLSCSEGGNKALEQCVGVKTPQIATFCLLAQAASTEGKGFFDVDWSDPTAAALEVIWRGVKIMLALSPLIAIVMLFCCTKDDPEEEELRRKKKFDFSLDSGE